MRLLPVLLPLLLLAPRPLPSAHLAVRDDTELARHMERIEDALKSLRRAMRTPEEPAPALTALVEIQRATLECKGLVPESAAGVPEGEREAYVRAYRRTIVEFLQNQLELEAALLDGDAEAAQAAFQKVRAMEDSGHERFAPEEH